MALTKRQKTIIHVAAGKLGISDDERRDVLQAQAGVRSAADPRFTRAGFLRVMRHFEKSGFKAEGRRPEVEGSARPGMATAGQLRKIYKLWWLLEGVWYTARAGKHRALREFLQKRFRVSHENFLSFDAAEGVIEALKAIGAREGREGARREA